MLDFYSQLIDFAAARTGRNYRKFQDWGRGPFLGGTEVSKSHDVCFWYCICDLATCIRLHHNHFYRSPKASKPPLNLKVSIKAQVRRRGTLCPSPVDFLAAPSLPRCALTVRKRAWPALTRAIRAQLCSPPRRRPRNFGCGRWSTSTTSSARSTSASGSKSEYCSQIMFTTLWMWRQEYQHHEQLPLAFNGTWPSWNSDLDNRPW